MSDNSKKTERINRIREAKNNLILDAALEVFSKKSFYESRLEDIAAAAGFSKASLYNYYKDKETIFLSLALREHTVLNDKIKSDPLLMLKDELSFNDNLKRFLTLIFSTFGKHFSFLITLESNHFAALFDEVRCGCSSKNSTESQFVGVKEEVERTIFELIKRAQESGEINSTLTVEKLLQMLNSLIDGTLKEWYLAGEMGSVEKSVDELIEFISSGFGI